MTPFLEEVRPDSKREMLRSALRLFVKQGFLGTTVRDIADDSGFTNPALFKHYRSVQALAQDLYEAAYRRVASALWDVVTPGAPAVRNMKALTARTIQLVDQELELFLFVQENLRTFWPQVPRDIRALSLVRLFMQVLEGTPPDDAKVAVAALLGFMGQFARLLYFGEFTGGPGAWGARVERMALAILKEWK